MQIVWCLGGLANQMMQYAFARRIELDGYKVKLDLRGFANYGLHNGYELDRVFKVKILAATENEIVSIRKRKLTRNIRKLLGFRSTIIQPKDFRFSESYLPQKDNNYISGFWNSEKFFLPYKSQIIKDFTFPKLTEPHNISLRKNIIAENSISMHVRRGDYVNNPLHGNVCSKNYYHNAIEFFKKKISAPCFYIFSNDINWCKENLSKILESFSVIYVTGNNADNSYRDMQLMSLCRHNIIANSAFSWWGAYLNANEDKIVVAPDKWFNTDKDQSDIVPEGWIQLPIT